MIASTTPSGRKATRLRGESEGASWTLRNRPASWAKYSQEVAHLSTSASASAIGLPISPVISRERLSRSRRSSWASSSMRSDLHASCSEEIRSKAACAFASLASISPGGISWNSATTSSVAGLTELKTRCAVVAMPGPPEAAP